MKKMIMSEQDAMTGMSMADLKCGREGVGGTLIVAGLARARWCERGCKVEDPALETGDRRPADPHAPARHLTYR